jgi:hypothetical protein
LTDKLTAERIKNMAQTLEEKNVPPLPNGKYTLINSQEWIDEMDRTQPLVMDELRSFVNVIAYEVAFS